MSEVLPPLHGCRVLDLSRVLAGPYCSMILGDLGAEVIKIEIPERGDDTRGYPPHQNGVSSYFLSVNRNKMSVTLNLKTREGREITHRLASNCDVILENFRPGVTKRLGVDYDTLRSVNPGLIYASISSFGQSGPYADLPGYDLIIQGMGGLMGVTGDAEGEPVRIGVAITDLGAGMWAVIAILAALNHRQRTGEGQYIDVSMLDGSISWMTYAAGNYFATGENPPKMGTAHPSIVPYQAFTARDGRSILIATGNDRLFRVLCSSLGLEDLADDERFRSNSDRVEHREDLIPLLEAEIQRRERDAWLERLRTLGLPCGPVYTMEEIFSDPNVLHREMLQEVKHTKLGGIKQIGPTLKFGRTPCEIRSSPPLLGQHTEEVLTELLDYTQEEIDNLKEKGVI
ncbi:MAG: CaiB/BaiF CoA transferase family protein [Candidatus Bathyarchaeia archaeon]